MRRDQIEAREEMRTENIHSGIPCGIGFQPNPKLLATWQTVGRIRILIHSFAFPPLVISSPSFRHIPLPSIPDHVLIPRRLFLCLACSPIPDMALLVVGQYDYDWYQPESSDILSAPAESTWCTEPPDPSNLLSKSLQCSSEAWPPRRLSLRARAH